MSEAELIFTALAELSTRQVAETQQATGLKENQGAAVVGGRIAKQARRQLEDQTGRSVVTGENYLAPPRATKALPKAATKATTRAAAKPKPAAQRKPGKAS